MEVADFGEFRLFLNGEKLQNNLVMPFLKFVDEPDIVRVPR